MQMQMQKSTLLLARHDLLDVRELADGGHLRDSALERAHLLLPLGHLVLERVESVAHDLELVELVAGHLSARQRHRWRVASGRGRLLVRMLHEQLEPKSSENAYQRAEQLLFLDDPHLNRVHASPQPVRLESCCQTLPTLAGVRA